MSRIPLRKPFEQTDTVLSQQPVALTARVACKLQPNFDFGICERSFGFEGLEHLLSATVE
jgi:hypothetical protein